MMDKTICLLRGSSVGTQVLSRLFCTDFVHKAIRKFAKEEGKLMKVTFCWATGVIAALSVAVSQAAPIASDSFAVSAGGNDYVPFTAIFGQNPTVGAPGFIGAWGISSTGIHGADPWWFDAPPDPRRHF